MDVFRCTCGATTGEHIHMTSCKYCRQPVLNYVQHNNFMPKYERELCKLALKAIGLVSLLIVVAVVTKGCIG